VLTDGDSGNRKQTNLLLQATWQDSAKTKLGLNLGESKLKDGAAADLRTNTNVAWRWAGSCCSDRHHSRARQGFDRRRRGRPRQRGATDCPQRAFPA
jgi:hypothetical protein